jgi:Zn-dependent peptidase ImmA (M78 family)
MTRQIAFINKKMLIWARKTISLSIELASEKIGVSSQKLEQWEDENSVEFPTVSQLYKIASIYKRPFAVFYFPEPPKHFKPLKDFRKFPKQEPLSERDEYILQKELLLFQRKREIAIDLYEQLEIQPPEFSLKSKMSELPEKLAEKIIKYLGIDHQKILDTEPGYDALNLWKNLLENNGILIFQTTGVPLNVMRGACIAKDALPVIIINSNDSQNGRIFSLFHELVHIVLREDGISNFRHSNKGLYDAIEVFCNQVAAEILVPSKLLLSSTTVTFHRTGSNWSNSELSELSRHFCVSQEVILRRLLSLNKTSDSFYDEFRSNIKFDEKKKQSGGDYYRNIIAKNGVLYLNLAIQGYYQNILTASSLSDFIQIKMSNLPKLEQQLYAKVQH